MNCPSSASSVGPINPWRNLSMMMSGSPCNTAVTACPRLSIMGGGGGVQGGGLADSAPDG